ncbi:MAG: IS110 family transposase, partial [Candidatus Sedimenticola endophacoides]
MRRKSTMKISHVGVDIAKSVFQIHAADRLGKALWRVKLSRSQWIDKLCEKVPATAVIAMESCAGAHHWARVLQARGYTVRLIDARFVKPYVKSNKNDRADAEAICEALTRPGMRFVTPKSVAQQDIQAMHRIRAELVDQRTAKANQIRGLVGEYGIVAPRGIGQLRQALPDWCELVDSGLSMPFRALLQGLYEDLKRLDERVSELDEQIGRQVAEDSAAKRLMELRGVGPLIASALSASLGDGKSFKCGRDFAASLGLT